MNGEIENNENEIYFELYPKGPKGEDAKINGKNSIEIEAGNNITIDDTENGIRINSTGGGSGGTSNYNDLRNKPKINNVELSGNKSLNDLGIQPAGNYALESEIPTKTSDLTNDSGFITGYTETDPTVPSYVKNITQANISSWNNKSDFSGSYNDLSNKPTIPEELKDLSDDSTHRLVTDTEKSTWNNKQNTISDLSTIRSGASAGATAVQPSDLATVATSGSYNDLSNKPSDVTESTVSGWGFTKNTGTYSKPSGGIPKSDLESSVQTSLGKADTALQSYTETDPTVPSYVKNISQTDITNWNNKSEFSGNYNDLTNKPTIPVVPTNVSAFTNDVGYLTQHQDISGKANKISVVQTSASTIEINSNTFYKFGEVVSLNITLASITDNTIYNEYMFEFVSGATATTLTLPDTIKWLETPTIESNKIYQCSIVDNIGILAGVANV